MDVPLTWKSNPTEVPDATNLVNALTQASVAGLGASSSPPTALVAPEYSPGPTNTGDNPSPVTEAVLTSSLPVINSAAVVAADAKYKLVIVTGDAKAFSRPLLS